MKKKMTLSVIVVVTVLVAVIGGMFFYNNQTTVPKNWVNRILTVDNTENRLSNWFDLYFTNNHALLVAKKSKISEQKKTKLNKEILQAYSTKKNNPPQTGVKADLGRVDTTESNNGYTIRTKKVVFIFTKMSDGSYRSQDGTVWQFSPKE